ncbi:hypothetical protein [uncultured Sneathiella sp.]|jgi:hypothetical protein|uniref:hypothetical protein n=1 Tax=uncultured Sneathiella sp. TaxID=879315 RepID=UPI0030DAAD61|tara:strand:- start:25776 stop:26003 length:228 start_codon:yes stop_codon:yes gene_type:complete
MAEEDNVEETPAAFLVGLGKDLACQKDVDVNLVDILKKHLLTTLPADDALEQSKVAIIALANARAAPLKKEEADG